jgi:hypothetical protein
MLAENHWIGVCRPGKRVRDESWVSKGGQKSIKEFDALAVSGQAERKAQIVLDSDGTVDLSQEFLDKEH